MTLLREIQDGVIDSSSDLSTVLRKARLLAARLKNAEFTLWVKSELDGYAPDSPLPPYRIVDSQSYGDFFGPYGSAFKNAPIPTNCLPENLRGACDEVEFRQGVRALSEMLTLADKGMIRLAWPTDVIPLMANRVYQNMTLGQAWRAISTSSIAGLLDSIRNRLLNFVIDIESIAPDVAESSSLPPSLTPQLIGNIYNMNITGNVGNLATGSSQFSQDATNTISTGDWTGLKQYLTSLGVTESDLDELKLAIDQEPSVTSPLGFGSKVAGWLGGMVTKSAQGLFEFGSAVAADLISRALAQYYGLP